MLQFRRFVNKNLSYGFVYVVVGLFIIFSLIITIALLIWHFHIPTYLNNMINRKHIICTPNLCSSTVSITSSSTSIMISISTTSITTLQTSESITFSSTTKQTNSTKRSYKESCDQLFDCYAEYGLLCEYGWNETKSCLCEGSHYWSMQQNKCLRKGEINESCNIDYQCHREIGLVCDKRPGESQKRCICASSIYWAKDSNCGKTAIRRIVDCIDENYASTCLVIATNNIYHMVTIRSITEKELSFDWFLIDNRILQELPQLSCSLNNETRYCFGLSIQDAQHALKLAQFTRKGFHNIENLGGTNQGIPFGLTDINNVAVYVRNSQNILYRRIIADDEVLSSNNLASALTGDPACYIHELLTSRQIYCFARNSAYGLTEYIEKSNDLWQATQLGNLTDRIRDETAPTCSYVGQIYRFCFSVFENGEIYRILWKSGVWSSWKVIGREQNNQFVTQPVFLTSKPLNESSSDQTCYLLAIDIKYNLQLSTNINCAKLENFSEWTPLSINMKFKQFDKTFRLRDGTIGVLGIDDQNQPYFIYLDSKTQRFTLPHPAFTIKSEEFRP